MKNKYFNTELREQVLEKAIKNHIWINAFSLVNPSKETLQSIGQEIVYMLNDKNNTLPAYHNEKSGEVSELQKLTPILYLSINKS
jgi:hypothetical protein